MKIIIFVIGLFLFLPHQLFALDLYVAPDGNDANPGTKEKPFRTLPAARDSIRKVNKTMTEDIVVYIRGGLYSIKETIEFAPQDSGFNGHKVIYRAFSDETPVFSGGIELTNWTLYNKDKNIYQSKVPKGIYRQLYINGKRAVRARSPNKTSDATFGPYLKVNPTQQRELKISKEDWNIVLGIKDISEVELVVVSHWYQQRILVAKHRATKNDVIVTPVNSAKVMTKPVKFYDDSGFFFENSVHFIDQAGEWYHDRLTDQIFIAMPENTTPSSISVVIPRTEVLLDINGTVTRKVANLEFWGITFEATVWSDFSDQSINFTQFAQAVVNKARGVLTAGINTKNTQNIAFRNNTIRKMGGNAFYLENADDSDIEGNKIYQIAANGIVIDKEIINPKSDEQSSGVAIWNNHIQQAGQDYSNGGAVLANNVRGLIVEHNLINNMPYSGIQICNHSLKVVDIGCIDNRVCYNHVHHVMQLHDDGGGIYALGGIQKGTVIAENLLHNISRGEWGGTYPISMIYLDKYASKIMVRDNVIRGGKAEERNGAEGNYFFRNVQSDKHVESNAGIKHGYNPRLSSCQPTVGNDDIKLTANK
ncbi:MAG: right-handed parallel beta-helix repeat-containing protein [Gammaproteobacteria bacterium]|nr:right-handed parallel beta-helix repeat-containing protein [Gammaproteobacteria bacterium]